MAVKGQDNAYGDTQEYALDPFEVVGESQQHSSFLCCLLRLEVQNQVPWKESLSLLNHMTSLFQTSRGGGIWT